MDMSNVLATLSRQWVRIESIRKPDCQKGPYTGSAIMLEDLGDGEKMRIKN
jgi:hypothetical protein